MNEEIQEVIKKETPGEEKSLTPTIPQETSIVNDYDIDAFLEKRKEFIEKVNAIMVESQDYHVIQNKKSLAKGGAEKIASIFGWTANFRKDQDVADAFTEVKGLISFVCDLSKNGSPVGQGRGAAILQKNAGDPNKTIKMAQKSAFIDAVLRASGLSDFFTQDLEDMNGNDIQKPSREATRANVHKASEAQRNLITKLKNDKGYTTEDLVNEGFDKSDTSSVAASKIIKFLLEAPVRVEINVDDIPY